MSNNAAMGDSKWSWPHVVMVRSTNGVKHRLTLRDETEWVPATRAEAAERLLLGVLHATEDGSGLSRKEWRRIAVSLHEYGSVPDEDARRWDLAEEASDDRS